MFTDCTCGHSEEEHGNSLLNPFDHSCDACPCAVYERDTSDDDEGNAIAKGGT